MLTIRTPTVSDSQYNSAAVAKSFQSCLTLCDPIDSSPPGSAIPGILQARTLEWVAISFSNSFRPKHKYFQTLPNWRASLGAQLIKESACNARDLGSIPGLGRSPKEGKGYPVQYSGLENTMNCIVHVVAKSQTRLERLFHFHALEKEMATHSSVLAWRIPGMAGPGGLPSMGSHRVGHN